LPHPGQRDHPEDRWSDASTPSGGEFPRADLPRPRRRALRLAGAIGIIVGGLCVVLGTLALVVEVGPRRATVLTYQGHHTERPKQIKITWPGSHEVAWSFTCPPGRTGTFKMAGSRAAVTGNAPVAASGPNGNGHWLDRRTQRRRSLFILADCSWEFKVFRPASTASAAPQPGPGDNHNPGNQHRPGPANAHKKYHGHKKHPHTKRVPQRKARH
jgi:hypothetical protein